MLRYLQKPSDGWLPPPNLSELNEPAASAPRKPEELDLHLEMWCSAQSVLASGTIWNKCRLFSDGGGGGGWL